MADRLDAERRSRNMAAVKNKHTAPEVAIRQALAARGLRCSTHSANLPGRPDLVFNSYKAVIFVHGCFWHMHDCKLGALPTSNIAMWHEKLQKNKERDAITLEKLKAAGWRVRVIWLCELKNKRYLKSEEHIDALVTWITSALKY